MCTVHQSHHKYVRFDFRLGSFNAHDARSALDTFSPEVAIWTGAKKQCQQRSSSYDILHIAVCELEKSDVPVVTYRDSRSEVGNAFVNAV